MKTTRRDCIRILIGTAAALLSPLPTWAAKGNKGKRNRKPEQKYDDARGTFLSDVPDSPGNILLGRPTDRSITASLISFTPLRCRIEVTEKDGQALATHEINLEAGEPLPVAITGLTPDTQYEYRVIEVDSRRHFLPASGPGLFCTQRSPGSEFTFTIQADSHLDGQVMPQLYEQTIGNALESTPDFHVDLGDTFMVGKIKEQEAALRMYLAQRYYLGQIGHSAPIFLVLGNHDGEETARRGSTDRDGLAVWANTQRKRFFPNPEPDRFYTGNTFDHPHAGLLQNYYAWTWGDAMFIVLDPYWYSKSTRGGQEPWNMTIGDDQYHWLTTTLRKSQSTMKFVFIHQLTGGVDKAGRGGREAALLYEWGGREKDGKNSFKRHRPDWEKPIHELLVETGVNAVFHGHDHFFAHQELDGVTYQLVPQPAHRNSRNHQASEYGYLDGHFIPNSGHLKVKVTPDGAQVEYIRSALANMEKRGIKNGTTEHSYWLK